MAYSEEFLDKTIKVFQPRTSKVLTREDAREIIENATGFFTTLLEWDAAARARAENPDAAAAATPDPAPPKSEPVRPGRTPRRRKAATRKKV